MKKVIKILSIFLGILIVSFILPIKFCRFQYPSPNSKKDFLVVRHDSTKNWWILTGDKEGLQDWDTVPDIPVTVKGKRIEDIVSADLYVNFEPTYFILWGDIETKENYDPKYQIVSREIVIDCTDWDILGDLSSRNSFRSIFCRKYLTIYDYKWFDVVRLYDEF